MIPEQEPNCNRDLDSFLNKNIDDAEIIRLCRVYWISLEECRDVINRELISKISDVYYLDQRGRRYLEGLIEDIPDPIERLNRFLFMCRRNPPICLFKSAYKVIMKLESQVVEIQPPQDLPVIDQPTNIEIHETIEKVQNEEKIEIQELSDNIVLAIYEMHKKGLAKVNYQDVEKGITRFKDKPKNPEEKIVYFLQHPEKFQMNLKKANTFVNDTFNFSLFARGPVFNVMSTEERSRYTVIKDGFEEEVNRPDTECFDWECGRFEISGPYLCTGDAKVLNALLFLHKRNFGLVLKTTGLKLAQTLGIKTLNKNGKHSLGGKTYYRLARHLMRLGKCHIEFQPSPKHKHLGVFSGKILSFSLSAQGLVVQFNKSLIIHTQRRAFSQLDMRFLNTLNAMDYRLVTFLESHEYGKGVNACFQRSLSFMKELFYPNSHNQLDDFVFNGRIRNSIKRLKDAQYLHQDSCFENGQYVFRRLERKPYLGEVNLQSISHLRIVKQSSGTVLVDDNDELGQVVNLGQKEENPHLGG